ncbi:hypothetical protein GCM10028807_59870 [Spirosoma daeguense]
MYVDFDKLSDKARVWVYQANRLLTDDDIKMIDGLLKPALNQWAAHGQPLLASAEISENRFIVIGVDESYSLPSGCSIDDSARTIRSIGSQIGVDFFDRSAIVELADGLVKAIALSDLKNAVESGVLTPDTSVFNTLVPTKADYLTNWRIRAAESWLGRYFKRATV